MPGPRYTGGHVSSTANVGSQYDINVAGTSRARFTTGGLAVTGTLSATGAFTASAGGLTVVGTTSIDTSCTSLTLDGLPTSAACLTSGMVYVALSGCCCCVGTLSIIP
jgi:hypothetical protein